MAASNGTIDYIDHEATVVFADRASGKVTVELAAQAGCNGCAAAAICNPGGKKMREFTVDTAHPERFGTGDHVILRGTAMMHRKAMTVATVIPSVALVIVMVMIYVLTGNEVAAALGGLGSMIFFFVMLWLFRDRIAKEFRFDILHKRGE